MLSANEAENKTDNELVADTLSEQENFLYLVHRYKTKLFYYIQRISNVSSEEAEDILQNVFIKVYINLNDFDADLKFSSWIYRITHNEVIDNHRKNKARPQSVSFEIEDDRIKKLADDFDIENQLDKELLKKTIMEQMMNLDSKFREILILKFIEEKDYKEISDIIQKPLGTVASRLNKAKEELKKHLKDVKLS